MNTNFAGGMGWNWGERDEGEDGSLHPTTPYLLPWHKISQDFMMSLNIRSLNAGNKLDALRDLLNRHTNCRILCLQEIWSLDMIPTLPGFQKLYYKCRSSTRGGGVGIYVSDKYKYTVLDSPFYENKLESLAVKISINPYKSIKVVNLYIKPNQKLVDLLPLISTLPTEGRNTMIAGDFNFNLMNKKNCTLVERFNELGLQCIVDQPTRVIQTKTGLSKTLVDHIYTNVRGSESFILTTDISDHFTVCATIQSNWKTRKKEQNSYAPLQDDKSLSLLKQYFTAVDWKDTLGDNSKKAFKKFSNIVKEAMEICCPPTAKNKRTQPLNPWMSPALLVSRRVKDKLHHKAIKSSKTENWTEYQVYRNLYTKLVRKAKILFYGNQFKLAKNSVRETWRLSNEVMGRTPKKGSNNEIGPIKNCNSQLETAECFNEFYSNIATQLADKIPKTDVSFKSFLPKIADDVEELDLERSVDELTIEIIIRNMKSKRSFSHDYMSNYALKAVRQPLLKPLTHLISLSLKLGYVPKDWKKAKLIPIYKGKGEKDETCNYRGISILPTFSKIIEKIVANRVHNHMETNGLFYDNQFGFRRNMSCESLLLKFMDRLSNAKAKNKHFLAIFIDFAKAFDTLNINILLKKIAHYKIPTKWFRSYLSGRTQFIQIGTKTSESKGITCGVPQGSVLGPLLFLLATNCLPNSSDFFALMFADDTTLLLENKDLDLLFLQANLFLKDFEKWCYCNYLSLAPSKTRFILFSKPENVPKLYLMNEQIIRVHEQGQEKSFKLVGVKIDDSVSWHHHVDYVRQKINIALGMMRRSKNVIPPAIKKMIYNSLINSHISYCLPIWGNAKSKVLDPLIKAQKRALRIVNNEHWLKHCDPLFASLDCLKLTDQYKVSCGKLAVKFFQKSLPPGLSDCFQEKIQVRTTRLSENNRILNQRMTKDATVQRMSSYSTAHIWNNLVPISIKDYPEASFITAYKNHFIQEYNDFKCNRENCYSCESRFIR